MTRKSKIIIGALGLFTLFGMITTAASHSGSEVKSIQAEALTTAPTVEPTKIPTQIPMLTHKLVSNWIKISRSH